MKIYLAGGTHSGWQKNLIVNLMEYGCELTNQGRYDTSIKLDYFDPSENKRLGFTSFPEYSVVDLMHVRTCDIVFCYLEQTNPGCIGAIVEMAYGKGLGKTTILCLETKNCLIDDRYLRFATKVADYVTDDINKAIDILKGIIW